MIHHELRQFCSWKALEFLPSYSQELQPAERLGPLLDEPILNELFEALAEVVAQRCCQLAQQPEWFRGLTQFHWWWPA